MKRFVYHVFFNSCIWLKWKPNETCSIIAGKIVPIVTLHRYICIFCAVISRTQSAKYKLQWIQLFSSEQISARVNINTLSIWVNSIWTARPNEFIVSMTALFSVTRFVTLHPVSAYTKSCYIAVYRKLSFPHVRNFFYNIFIRNSR